MRSVSLLDGTVPYLTAAVPGVGGRIRSTPEDFHVDERPLYLPCGEGEHLYLRITKRGLSTPDLVLRLSSHLGVKAQSIGVAGLKDAQAVTSQMVSLHGVKEELLSRLQLDDRLLASLKEFFKLLDDGGATLKLVEGQKEYVLQREDVERARTRADSMEIGEREQEETGIVYLLPASRRFELHPTDAGPVRRGTVTADCLIELRGEAATIPPEVIGRPWRVRLKVREVRQRSGAAKVSHTLTRLIERV